jgi:cell division septum initiation protein DivIVA
MAMDILHLIDRLEDELSRGRRLPFSDIVMLNEQRLWNVIDTMRISIPREVEAAEELNRARERVLAQADEQRNRILESARNQVEEMTAGHELIQSAKAEASGIVARARDEAQRFQSEADSYALEVLSQLEEQLKRVLQTVHNGAELLSANEEADSDDEA